MKPRWLHEAGIFGMLNSRTTINIRARTCFIQPANAALAANFAQAGCKDNRKGLSLRGEVSPLIFESSPIVNHSGGERELMETSLQGANLTADHAQQSLELTHEGAEELEAEEHHIHLPGPSIW